MRSSTSSSSTTMIIDMSRSKTERKEEKSVELKEESKKETTGVGIIDMRRHPDNSVASSLSPKEINAGCSAVLFSLLSRDRYFTSFKDQANLSPKALAAQDELLKKFYSNSRT